jgi:signal transduction histidine kinase
MPSVQLLAAARTDLRHIAGTLQENPSERPVETLRASVKGARSDFDAKLEAYAQLPFFPAERALHSDVLRELPRLDDDLMHSLEALERHDARAPIYIERTLRDIDVLDENLARVIEFDASQGQRLGLQVVRVRRSAGASALAFNAVAVGLAALAAALAARQVRNQMKLLETARDWAANRATVSEERNTELELFAGRVAHDVLSPLAGANMALELARTRLGSDGKATAVVDRGLRSVARARRIVDGLLEFARAGAKPTEGATANVVDVVTDVVEGTRADAEAAGIDLVVGTIEPCSVACSAGALTSIVANLVRNAIKHMDDAPVRGITVRASRVGESVRFEVEDTGPGIAPDHIDEIFEPFKRGASKAPGIGLGLATVKRLVCAHGGRVGCRSTLGAGSTFWFELAGVDISRS